MNDHETPNAQMQTNPSPTPQRKKGLFKGISLKPWELGLLLLSFILVAFMAVPNFLHALAELRGQECNNRLVLLANCLEVLAERNNTQPGEKICELFDLNEMLIAAQRGSFVQTERERATVFYKIGAEPDCPDIHGEHHFEKSLYLGEDGNIVLPTCSLAEGEAGRANRERGWHVCDPDQVTGELKLLGISANAQPSDEPASATQGA